MTTDDIAIQEHDNLMRKSAMDMKDKSFNYSIIKNSETLIWAFHVKMRTTTNKADV